ncbi:hypothetical protein [Massilia sp. CT11-137]|uniref:hypothetical protein n=1 Tax=Massilia sp. CT11-137 TaxID=3393901 RepID=UPI0039A65910
MHRARPAAGAAMVTLAVAVAPGSRAESPPAAAPDTPEMQWNRQLLASGRVEQLSSALTQSNRATQAAVDESVLDRVRKSLPALDQFGNSLKYGSFAVVSAQGPEIVSLIRTLPSRTGNDRNAVLKKLLQLSRQGVPEAQNFSGFVYEYGLFGAPRNLPLARDYYAAAASRRYQPAILNLAHMAWVGKGQQPDADAARELAHQAVDAGVEASGRVCGLATFIEYRCGEIDLALRLGKFCQSALANIPNAAYGYERPVAERIRMLRDSLATGVPDGYRWLEDITQRAGPDRAHLYCKYRLVNQLGGRTGTPDLPALARTCYANTVPQSGGQEAERAVRDIATFAAAERRLLEQSRRANRFRQFQSVPYLPFSQGDVDLYEPVMKESR